ncbi:MAG: bifunctional DNA-formamidopyrimidine glycosylase/DNA-(apurinic or apyrimidinic site) lyase [Gammaproteobacteria bacterium]|nr:bifunctional DNA-formamidopyrimidine glycosylase/DNA-(apurinic or apyrimidinic site) lyase [Gammaproteobacteria bacterium]
MPELPEVETTRRGIEPHTLHQTIDNVIIRQRQLRWPITAGLAQKLCGHVINSVQRRGKYLLLGINGGTLLIHLGMSGNLRMVDANEPAAKHDHVDIVLSNGQSLRFHDPRRFGAILYTTKPAAQHKLLASLGPEPLGDDFSAERLYQRSRNKKCTIKSFIMDAKIVVGVGNIYASESLFRAGIHPKRTAGQVSLTRYQKLAKAIVEVLNEAIEQGGTTLKDFIGGDGKPGYFQQTLAVYGREGEACVTCGKPIKQITLGQRSTFYCPKCQKS